MPLFRKKAVPARQTTTIVHPQIGELTVCRSARARRITISVRPPDRVRLTVPWSVDVADGMRFAQEKAAWIAHSKERMAARATSSQVIEMPFSTRCHELDLRPGEGTQISVKTAYGRITVGYPAEIHYSRPEIQQAIRQGIEHAWRIEARELLPQRVAGLAAIHGFKYGALTFRNARTRWGSCSGRNDISLSIRLMMLSDELIDYIILHELCHTVHKNHGPRFHALLDKVTAGRHMELRRKLKSEEAPR